VVRFLGLLLLGGVLILAGIVPFDLHPFSPVVTPGIRLLDQRQLVYDRIDGVPFYEISDLTWLPGSRSLYLLSDRGLLYRFEATFDNHMHLKPMTAWRLRDRHGKRLPKHLRDSEGLCHDAKGRLIASFEGRPRIAELTPDGKVRRTYPLPKALATLNRYHDNNKGLEAVAWHPIYGILTAKERPRKNKHRLRQRIYSLGGKRWDFRAEDLPDNGLTAMEVMEDGNLLVLERSFDKKNFRITITLKKVYLDRQKNGLCTTRILAQLRSDEGWILDNFEGLARVAPHRYIMISDDGNNPFERTLLIYFETKD